MAKKKAVVKTAVNQVSTAPLQPIRAKKKDLAQEALDLLGTATPSTGYDSTSVRWITETTYARLESLLSSLV